jgi:hypothetical protein
MTEFHSAAILWAVVGAAVLGLISAASARLAEGSSRQATCQYLFFGLLTLNGTATLLALGLEQGCWLFSGVAFSLMVLTATWDVSRDQHAGAWEW